MYFGCFDFRGELGFLNCDDIFMCVVNKQFELLEFVFSLFMLTCSMIKFISLLLLGLCGVCSPVIVLTLYVRLSWYPMLLLRWLWCMYCCLCWMCVCCEGDGDAGVGSWGGVVVLSVYMGGTHGSGVLSSAGDVVVRKVGYVSVFWLWWCGWCWGSGWVCSLSQGLGGWGGVMSVCVVSLDYLCWWQVQVSVYCARRIPAHLMCTQCSILLHFIDICFLTYICMWQISQIQTCLRVVVGSGLVSRSLAFRGSIASHPMGPHGRLAQKEVIGPPLRGRDGLTQFSVFVRPLWQLHRV